MGARGRRALRRRPAAPRRGAGARAAADAFERLGLRGDAAQSLLALGRGLRRHRKWGGTRDALERRRPRSTRSARRLGGRGALGARARRRAAADTRGELTPAERQVVELAADGSSNKEIAQALFVTVRTVEAHLTHAYAKLGVRSRAQLASRLGPPMINRFRDSGTRAARRSSPP